MSQFTSHLCGIGCGADDHGHHDIDVRLQRDAHYGKIGSQAVLIMRISIEMPIMVGHVVGGALSKVP